MTATVEGDNVDIQNEKKRKLSDGEVENSTSNVFKNFKLDRILRQDHKNKLVTFLGRFADDEESKDAVVLLERLPFEESRIEGMLTSENGRTEETLKNNIYSTHNVFTSRIEADAKATLICPATSKHVEKYSEHASFIVRETPQLYDTVTKPCIQSSQFSIQWVYNILDKKTEADRVVFEDLDPDTGFVLLPDMKWNRSDVSALYLVAIVRRHNLGSLRDLRAQHLPLLRNILGKGKQAIKDKFGLLSDQLRIYLHYQPSYTHLHVHFTHLRFDAPGSDCLRAHLLDDVIDHLEMDGDFYAKKTLTYTVRQNDALFEAYQSHGYFESQ
ncbi:hypothetical protein ACOMHN_042450 [Nucella lapillus]